MPPTRTRVSSKAPYFLQSFQYLRNEGVVRAGEDRDAQYVDVLLDRGLDNLFRRPVEAGVDDLEPGVTERPGDDVCPAVVPVEADLRHETPDRSLGLLPGPRSCTGVPRPTV